MKNNFRYLCVLPLALVLSCADSSVNGSMETSSMAQSSLAANSSSLPALSSGKVSSSLGASSSATSSADAVSSSATVVPPVPAVVAPVLLGDSGVFVDDRDQQKYRWIRIGTQVWMRQNLNYSPTGAHLSDASLGVADSSGELAPTYNLRKDDGTLMPDGASTIGRFYNWKAATTYCPSGWHLPSSSEFFTLQGVAYGYNSECPYSSELNSSFGVATCANVLKSKYGWLSNGFDTLGFEGTPADGGGEVNYWTTTPSSTAGKYEYHALYYHFVSVRDYDDLPAELKSVRCVANVAVSSSSVAVASSASSSASGQVYTSGTLKIPYKTTTITVPVGTYSPTYASSCTSHNLYMAGDCSVVIGGISMLSIEKYTALPTTIQLKSSCQLSCD